MHLLGYRTNNGQSYKVESNKNVDARSVFLVQSSQNEGIQTQRYVRMSSHGILIVAMERFKVGFEDRAAAIQVDGEELVNGNEL